jgi:hypothetical protein
VQPKCGLQRIEGKINRKGDLKMGKALGWLIKLPFVLVLVALAIALGLVGVVLSLLGVVLIPVLGIGLLILPVGLLFLWAAKVTAKAI